MLAFAANSLLCRMALQRTGIDPASFTAVRRAAGATVLAQLVGPRKRAPERAGSWASAATRAAGRAGLPGGAGVAGAVWYTVLRQLRSTSAATVQLSVPVSAALGGVLWLGEPLSTRLVLASAALLGGVAAVMHVRTPYRPATDAP